MTSTPDRTEHAADELNQAIGPDVTIPGPFPTGSAPTSKEAAERGSAEALGVQAVYSLVASHLIQIDRSQKSNMVSLA